MRILRARLLAAGAGGRPTQEASDARRSPGPHGRPLRAGPHLQLPGEPDLRPPGRLQGLQPRPGARRRPRRRRPGARRRRHRGQAGRRRRVSRPAEAAARGRRRRARLAAAGVPSARHDAEELAAHSLGVERRRPAGGTTRPAPRASRRTSAGGPRGSRCSTSPARACFRYLELAVGPGVFVPRPETEVVVGRGARRASAGWSRAAWSSTCAPAPARSRSPWPTRCPAARCTRSSSTRTRTPGPPATAPARRVDLQLGDMADGLPRAGRHRRRRGQQPAVHPARTP